MRLAILIIVCILIFACAKTAKNETQTTFTNTISTPTQLTKEEQLLELIDGKILDTSIGETESGETLIAIENLIKIGVDVNVRDKLTFQTPTMIAVQTNRRSTLRLLLNAKADPNLQDNKGQTALMAAANYNDVEMVKMLLEHGAKTDIKDNNGFTALSNSEYINGTDGLEPQEKAQYLEIRRLLKK